MGTTSAIPRLIVHAAMSALYFLLMASTFNVIGVLLPAMLRDLHMDWSTAGLGFTLLGTACGLASMLPSLLVRRIGMSLTLLIGAATLALGYAAFEMAQSAALYEAGAVLLGIGFCLCGPVPGVNVIAQRYGAHAPSAIGLYFMLGGLGSVIGPKLVTLSPWIVADWRLF
ncbi:MAG: MFS transporter, partial [Alphaproteobacteria bacterium]|nr:MFS transporter [Alphaproteobacteria bacterium]